MALIRILTFAIRYSITICASLCLITLTYGLYKRWAHRMKPKVTGLVPISVNYHYTRECNKACGFCFHTAKTSYVASLEDAKRALTLLEQAGMKKINFAGGEPFLHAKHLGEMVAFAKRTLQLESVSIVSNGSKIRKAWLADYGQHLDILAVSCDSFDEATNIKIGRGSGDNVAQLFRLRDWCAEFGVMFKLNTVVCRYNFDEDMAERVAALGPFRWKCFQVLKVEGENDSDQTLRDVRAFEISDAEFELFCSRHAHLPCFVPESNKVMAESYLVLDEYLCFLSGTNKNIASGSVLEVGVQAALRDINWDEESFHERGGVYEWAKDLSAGAASGCNTENSKSLEW